MLIIIECYSKQAVQLVNSMSQDRSQYAMVIQEVNRLMGVRECVVTHICQEQNNVSHVLANFGRTEDRTIVLIQSIQLMSLACIGKNSFAPPPPAKKSSRYPSVKREIKS